MPLWPSQALRRSSDTSRPLTRMTPFALCSSSFSSFLLFALFSWVGPALTGPERILSSLEKRSATFFHLPTTLAELPSVQEIDELVDDWVPEPLCAPLTAEEQADLASVPVISGPTGPKPKLQSTGKTVLNFASYNFAGLAGNDFIKERAVETLRKYGLGSCGPPGFYGTIGTFPSHSFPHIPRTLRSYYDSCVPFSCLVN